ncbi:MAG TPA: Gfo/Idh/MocA family oxidoreductase [Gammaproteobacteria bacterium]
MMKRKLESNMGDAGSYARIGNVPGEDGGYAKPMLLDAWRKEERNANKPSNIHTSGLLERSCRTATVVSRNANAFASPHELINAGVRGLVIDSPNQMQVDWIVSVLETGVPVFCRKPPILRAEDACRMVKAARKNDCLLAINFMCRHIKGMSELREHIRRGELGNIRGLDITFRSRPDAVQEMFSETAGRHSLVFHLADLALWLFDYPRIKEKRVNMHDGYDLAGSMGGRQERLLAQINVANQVAIKLACSNRISSCDAVIDMGIYGDCGDGLYRGCNDTLFNFMVDSSLGYGREPTDRILNEWLECPDTSLRYDPAIENYVYLAELMSHGGD